MMEDNGVVKAHFMSRHTHMQFRKASKFEGPVSFYPLSEPSRHFFISAFSSLLFNVTIEPR